MSHFFSSAIPSLWRANKFFATASDDQTVRLWEVKNGQCLKILSGHSKRVWSVTFNPDGNTLASSSDDQTIRLWNVKNGQCLRVLTGHTQKVWSIAFSPDGHTLASGSDDQTVRLWDVANGQCLKTLYGYNRPVSSVAFNDNDLLASTSFDMIRLWDTTHGSCVKILQGHTDWVWSVVFNPKSNFSELHRHRITIHPINARARHITQRMAIIFGGSYTACAGTSYTPCNSSGGGKQEVP